MEITQLTKKGPVVHRSLPKFLIKELIFTFRGGERTVGHTKTQRNLQVKKQSSGEGLEISTEPDHIKHLNSRPRPPPPPHPHSRALQTIFLTPKRSATVS